MKSKIIFVTTLFLSLSALSHSPNTDDRTVNVSGKIGKFVIDAMKSAGVEEKCNSKSNYCTYTLTKFYSATETDGCGGGTTSHEASFIYPNGKAGKIKIDGTHAQTKFKNAVSSKRAQAVFIFSKIHPFRHLPFVC